MVESEILHLVGTINKHISNWVRVAQRNGRKIGQDKVEFKGNIGHKKELCK